MANRVDLLSTVLTVNLFVLFVKGEFGNNFGYVEKLDFVSTLPVSPGGFIHTLGAYFIPIVGDHGPTDPTFLHLLAPLRLWVILLAMA